MKPKPFASLNHFTVPAATSLLLVPGGEPPIKRRLNETATPGPSDRMPSGSVRAPPNRKRQGGPWRSDRAQRVHEPPKTPELSARGAAGASQMFVTFRTRF